MSKYKILLLGLTINCFLVPLSAAQNRIDVVRPDAPSLATYGNHALGVRTLSLYNPEQIDIVNVKPSQVLQESWPRYTRQLAVEVWYPAITNSQGSNNLRAFMRDGKTQLDLFGKARRDAPPLKNKQKFPLVLISHGYPGNRFLLAHLAENIASKGYVVVSIDHTDSTYRTFNTPSSTLVNRPLDQSFTLNQIEKLALDSESFLFDLVDTKNTALIGYSMGGYGAMITAGAGLNADAEGFPWGTPHSTLNINTHNSKKPREADPRLKTIIAFAPWGMNYNLWDQKALEQVNIPILFVAGSQDDVSGYEKGVRALWQATSNIYRSLLTFDNANHSAGAPMPAPKESFVYSKELGIHYSDHYTDAVWDSTRMNNISQHFVTAWLGLHLKKETEMHAYLDLVPYSNDGIWDKNKEGKANPNHTYWKGFKNRTAKGLRLESLAAGEKNKY